MTRRQRAAATEKLDLRFFGAQNCSNPGGKWLISAGHRAVSRLFRVVILAFFDVTQLLSEAWEEKGGGVGYIIVV